MKWLFIFLLFANVIYFGWELDRQTKMDVSSSVSTPVLPNTATPIRFLHELDQLPAVRESSFEEIELDESLEEGNDVENSFQSFSQNDDPVALPEFELNEFSESDNESDSTGQKNCFSYGPIAEEAQADSLNNWFVNHGGKAQRRHKDEQGRQLFWVYLSPKESREAAMKTIRQFKDQGIRDFRLISKGDLENAISMGLFSSQAAVNRRLKELAKEGYKPVVVPYSDGKRTFWVDVLLSDEGRLLENIYTDFPSKFSSIPVRCEEIAFESDYS